MNLTNAIALITGGTAGIGRSIAKTLAESGARVAITGRDKNRLEEAARTLDVFPIHADVSNEADVIRSYREVLTKFGDLDIYDDSIVSSGFSGIRINGAGSTPISITKHFIKRNRGAIINIASTAGLRGAANGTAYYASKFALRGMTECWRAELRKYNIRVMLVNPSEVITNFAASAGIAQKSNETKLRGEEIAYAVKAILEMDERGFTPELSIFATNPID